MDFIYLNNEPNQIPTSKYEDSKTAPTDTTSFLEQINSKLSTAPNTAAMDPAEYKQYIYEKIQSMPAHPSKSNGDLMIFISEEGYAAMQQNPIYEQWVLSKIEASLAAAAPYGMDSFECLTFGASTDEYRHECVTTPNAQRKKEMRERYLKQREEHKKELQKAQEKKRLEAKWQKEAFLREAVRLQQIDHTLQIQNENKALRLQEDYQFLDHTAAIKAAARRKAAAYTSTFVYAGLPNDV